MTEHRARQLLPADPTGVVLARRMVGRLPLESGRAGPVKVAVSELVTNSVEHARLAPGDYIELRVRVDEAGAVRVEVRDPGPGPPPRPSFGLGLLTVARIADRWGVLRDEKGSCVWFELDPAR